MELLLAPETKPFAIATVMLLGLIGVELVTLMFGVSLSHFVEKSFHFEGHAGPLGWLNVGQVPLIILLIVLLGAFAATGYVVQSVAHAVWAPLPALIASAIAVAAALPMVRAASRAIAKIVPRDETYAVEAADLVGRTAEVTVGPLDEGLPGRVKLKDAYGNWHFPRARAAKGHSGMAVGSTVLLVDREGSCFLAVPASDELLGGR
jgi:membrane protein implicated in regulation of membrane protease activity